MLKPNRPNVWSHRLGTFAKLWVSHGSDLAILRFFFAIWPLWPMDFTSWCGIWDQIGVLSLPSWVGLMARLLLLHDPSPCFGSMPHESWPTSFCHKHAHIIFSLYVDLAHDNSLNFHKIIIHVEIGKCPNPSHLPNKTNHWTNQVINSKAHQYNCKQKLLPISSIYIYIYI